MADIATSFLGTIAGYTVVPIGRQFGYLFCYNGNIKKLRSQREKLEAKRRVVEEKLEAAKNNCQTIREDVDLWLSHVRSEEVKVDTILGNTDKVGKGCLNEWCLNLKSRYWVSRKAAKKSMDLDPLIEAEWNEVAGTQPPLAIVPAPDQIGSSSSGGLDSRVLITRDVMEAVKDDKIRMIGIWGMGGVGKTSMVKEVFRRAKLDKSMFDDVAMTAVSKEPEMKKIQEDIAEWLGLKLEEQNTSARADRLHCRLTQKRPNGKPKRTLIILDDVWYKLNLEEVGIPYEDSDQNGCKIVLTSRHKNVCDQMETNKTFFVKVLPEQEAWSLFRERNGNSLYASTDLHGIAEDIVKECGGLPIAIAIIASALVNQGEATWKYVLKQLKNSALEGEYAVVYKTLEMSYNFLKTKGIKDFFLLCCLFPEDFNIPIEDLVRYGMGLRFFKNIGNQQDERDEAHSYVETLKNSNLLLGGESEESVKMHDLVRDFALSMISKDESGFMVKFGNGLKAWPINDTYEYYTSISLQCDEMHELPVGLKLPNLKLLQLVCFSYRHSLQFPEEFYQGMGKLEVLVLWNMSIPSLPGSLQLLTNLRTLSLYECSLRGNISMIGYLEKLEILSFAGSKIEELTGEIGKLSRLRLLDLTKCRNLRRIPPSVLPSLTHLEELYMRGTFSFHWAEEESNATNASLAELKKLTNLVCIHIDIPLKVLPIDLTWEKLEKFNLFIGRSKLEKFNLSIGRSKLEKFNLIYYRSWTNQFSVFQNNLELCADNSVVLEGIMNALCMRTENLYLQVKDLKNLPESMGLLKLKRLIVESCDKLVSIVNTMGRRDTTTIVFPILESLILWKLSNLEDICCGLQSLIIPSSSTHQPAPFGNLREIQLRDCNKLKNIFSLSIARGLSKLQRLEIWSCQMMEEIFCNRDDEAVGKNIEFPNLKNLRLVDLPNLVGFCKAVEKVELPQLEFLYLRMLPKLTSLYPETDTVASEPHNASPKRPLFNQKVTLNNLEALTVSNMENLIEIWPSQFPDDSISKLRHMVMNKCGRLTSVFPSNIIQGMQNLEFLEVNDCDRLENIFSLSIAKGLVRVQSLYIRRCQTMEAIIFKERGEEAENGAKIEFPNLKKLDLHYLPNLIGLCKSVNEVELEFPLLKKLYLCSLPKLAGLYPGTKTLDSEHHHQSPKHHFFNPKVTLNNLKELRVSKMENLIEIWPSQFPDDSISKLRHMEVDNCGRLMSVFPSNIMQGIQNLEFLKVEDCDRLENIFSLSITRCLVRVQTLRIKNCQTMEAIIFKERGEEDENGAKIEFPNLNMLDLVYLPNLVGLCKTLDSKHHQESPKHHFFNPEVPLTNLVTLDICKMDHPTTVCPATVIQQLHNVGKLEVGECRSVEVVFDFQGLNINESRELVPLTQLKELIISKLPKLTHVWKKGQHVIQGFQNLTTLKIERCDSLKHLFTPSVAKILVVLEELKISGCMLFEAIVAKEEVGEEKEDEEILFPRLTRLYLSGLPNLLAIAPKPYTLNLPSLKELSANDCGKGAEPLNKLLAEDRLATQPKFIRRMPFSLWKMR